MRQVEQDRSHDVGCIVGRINLFLKGNLDLRDSLHSLRVNGEVKWNGVNEIVRSHFPGMTVRLQHETFTRSDALLAANGVIPDEISRHELPLGSQSAASQFSLAVFDAKADAIIFSILPDIMTNVLRHKEKKYLLYAGETAEWGEANLEWLRATFEPVALLDPTTSMQNFSRIIARCREKSDVPILIYNFPSVIPSDTLHCYSGFEDILSTRIKRFNLGLIELSQATGVSIIDVDSILARQGVDRLKIDALHLNAEGCRLVAEEVVRVLDDLGCMEKSK